MAALDSLMDLDPAPGTPEADKLELFAMLLEQYEEVLGCLLRELSGVLSWPLLAALTPTANGGCWPGIDGGPVRRWIAPEGASTHCDPVNRSLPTLNSYILASAGL
jgi:hypothetical protein